MEFGLFPFLSEDARRKLEALPELYRTWNAQINVVSRKDLDNLSPRDLTNVRQTKAGSSPREGGGFAPGQGERGRKGRDRSKYKQGRRGKRSW